ncbi:S-layer homology domain-containing protein [Candidatus Margulisiibacteriota bacterium]
MKNLLNIIVVTMLMCGIAVSSHAGIDSNPWDFAVGARTHGLGLAFTGESSDVNAIFVNPSGIAKYDKWQLTMMYSQLFGQFDYFMTAFSVPIDDLQTLGVSFINRSTGEVSITDVQPLDPWFPIVTFGSYGSQVLGVSYGRKIVELGGKPLWDTMYFGATAKLYSNSASGGGNLTEDMVSSGFDADMGVSAYFNDLAVGIMLKDFLPESMANLSWLSGRVENIPSSIRLGMSYPVLDYSVLLLFDYVMLPENNVPDTMHLGAEYYFTESLALRTGFAQSPYPEDEGNGDPEKKEFDMSLGVGWHFGIGSVDYAFKQYYGDEQNNTHIFSISFNNDEWKRGPRQPGPVVDGGETPVEGDGVITLNSPRDKLITTDEAVNFSGRSKKGDHILIGNREVPVENKEFSEDIPVEHGINVVNVYTPDRKHVVQRRILRLRTFSDIQGHRNKKDIEYAATLGYIKEDAPDTFEPDRYITRAEMAQILVKLKNLQMPVEVEGIWEDMDVAAAEGLFIGYPDGLMRPDAHLTRAQLAVILARLEGFKVDIKQKSYTTEERWFDASVRAIVSTGLFTNSEFDPFNASVTKAEAVRAINRTTIVSNRIDDLVNFRNVKSSPKRYVPLPEGESID